MRPPIALVVLGLMLSASLQADAATNGSARKRSGRPSTPRAIKPNGVHAGPAGPGSPLGRVAALATRELKARKPALQVSAEWKRTLAALNQYVAPTQGFMTLPSTTEPSRTTIRTLRGDRVGLRLLVRKSMFGEPFVELQWMRPATPGERRYGLGPVTPMESVSRGTSPRPKHQWVSGPLFFPGADHREAYKANFMPLEGRAVADDIDWSQTSVSDARQAFDEALTILEREIGSRRHERASALEVRKADALRRVDARQSASYNDERAAIAARTFDYSPAAMSLRARQAQRAAAGRGRVEKAYDRALQATQRAPEMAAAEAAAIAPR